MRHVVPAIGGDPIRVQATLWFRLGRWAILAVTLLLGWLVVTQAAQSLRHSEAFMGDFIYSFYPAVRYWLDGLNPYLGQYINASNGVYAPIYNPPWLLPVLIPIDMWPLDNAIVMWLSLNCILLIALARSALMWAHAPLRAPFQRRKSLGVLNDHSFQKGPFRQLWPEWDLRKVLQDKTEGFLFIPMGEGSYSCCDERVLKFHSFS